MVMPGAMRLIKYFLGVAASVFVLGGAAQQAQATPLYVLCLNDSSASTCHGSDTNWSEITFDGSTATLTNGAGSTATGTGSTFLGVTTLAFSGGSIGGEFTINSISGKFGSVPLDSLGYSVTSSTASAVTLHIFWAVANVNPGSYGLAHSGTLGTGATVTASVCGDTVGSINTDATQNPACGGTAVDLNGNAVSGRTQTTVFTAVNAAAFSPSSTITTSVQAAMFEEIAIASTANNATTSGTLSFTTPEPGTFGLSLAGGLLLAAGFLKRKNNWAGNKN